MRKPGAFDRYVYREELYPQPVFRQAYDRLRGVDDAKASGRYLRLLQLAAQFGEATVAAAIGTRLREAEPPMPEVIEASLREPVPSPAREIAAFTPDLSAYDSLITEVAS